MNKMLTFLIVTLLTAAALPLTVTADASQDIPTNAAGTGIHDSLVAALTHANLVATLQQPGPFTSLLQPTRPLPTLASISLTSTRPRKTRR
ncbi:MAG: hypothetical protein ACPGDD_01155 [Poseidonia sp.]